MSEYDLSQLNAEFAEFRATAAPLVTSAGFDQARATVRRRRQARIGAVGVFATVLIVAPIVAFAGIDRGSPPPPIVGASTPSSSGSPDSPTPSPSSSPVSSPKPTGSATPKDTAQYCDRSPAQALPNGAISARELCDATLTIPAWPTEAKGWGCLSGPVKLNAGHHNIGDSFHLNMGTELVGREQARTLTYADIDQDGSNETIALVSCSREDWHSQIVVFDRLNGKIRTIGKVLDTGGSAKRIFDVEATVDGKIRVEVGDRHGDLGDVPGVNSQRQWRTYAWDGQKFIQVDGPTTFPPNPNPS